MTEKVIKKEKREKIKKMKNDTQKKDCERKKRRGKDRME